LANIKSAAKRARIARKRRASNIGIRSRLRNLTQRFEAAVQRKDLPRAQELLVQAQKAIDSAVGRGILHRNAGIRRKSRLAKALVPLVKGHSRPAARTRRKTAPPPESPVEKKVEEEKAATP